MAELLFAPSSPFARKVRILALELGVEIQTTEMTTSPIKPNETLNKANPLAKIPCLIISKDESIYDSRVICRYLGENSSLYPKSDTLWKSLTREALADGLMDAAIVIRYEQAMRPKELQWQEWVDGQWLKVTKALGEMEKHVHNLEIFTVGDIATGCALSYLDLRFADFDWRKDYPALADFAAKLYARPSFVQTALK